jgi:glycine amidinotransferase
MANQLAVKSYNEWSQLNEVIVGRADGFPGFHLDNSFNLFFWDNVKPFLASKKYFADETGRYEWPIIEIETYIIEELLEDIQGLVDALEKMGVRVRRPSPIVGNNKIKTPFWDSIQSPPLNVRDQTIILGNCIVETSPHVRARLFENDYLKPLFYEYMQGGAGWINMPRPTLSSGMLDTSYFSLDKEEEQVVRDHHSLPLPDLKVEMIFDGAMCIRLGRDVLVNVANRNHELGFQWLKSSLGNIFNFHRLNRLADSHIDSMILPLRPGLWLLRNEKVLDYLPPKFQKWDFIVAPEAKTDHFPSYDGKNLAIASKYIDMNLLSVNENTVIVNSLFPELINVLEKIGFNVVPVRHRHRRLFGGGFHCFTLDINRSSNIESYV